VVSKLGPPHTWRRVTLRPHEGLYVKQQVAAAMELQQTQGVCAVCVWGGGACEGWVMASLSERATSIFDPLVGQSCRGAAV